MEFLSDNLNIIVAVFNFVGTIVIILSVLYLAKQTHLTNKIAQGETERELYDSYNEIMYRYSDYESIELTQRGLEDFNNLNNAEKVRFVVLYLIPHINNCESFYQLHKKKLISNERLRPIMNIVISILKTNGGKQCWNELQRTLNPEFVEVINCELKQSVNIPAISTLFTWMKPENPNKTDNLDK